MSLDEHDSTFCPQQKSGDTGKSADGENAETVLLQQLEVSDSVEETFTKRQIIRNLIVLSLGFVALFTSFGSLAFLQTSLNMESGTGTGSLSVIYAALILSCLFLPPCIIAQVGCKWAILISMTGYILYFAANMYPVWATMMPTAVLIGLGAAPLWSAKCTYLTKMAVWYARMTGQTEDAIINRFFGVFFMFFQSYSIWGNIIVFTVLSPSDDVALNATSKEQRVCGKDFCPEELSASNNTNLDRPVETKVYILCGVFVAIGVIGILIVSVFLDPLKGQSGKPRRKCVSPRLMVGTLKHIKNSRYQQLLIPLTIYSGIEQGFLGADFTRSYITCTMGIQSVGYVMICFGVVDAICSFLFGQLVKQFGHIPFFVIGFILHATCQIVLQLWDPDKEKLYVFYIIVSAWAMGDAVWQTQINALYGLLFQKVPEAGFANYRLWESVGFILSYAYSDFLCTSLKIHITMACLVVGMGGYAVVEVLYRREQKK